MSIPPDGPPCSYNRPAQVHPGALVLVPAMVMGTVKGADFLGFGGRHSEPLLGNRALHSLVVFWYRGAAPHGGRLPYVFLG